MDRGFLGVDAGVLRSRLLGVTAHEVETLHGGAVLGREDLQHCAGLLLVLAGQNDDAVALLDLGGHYSTSGASEMIFMWFLARSSRGTGPKIRVQIGSFALCTITAADLSKRISLPSLRLMPCAVRTTMARRTSPFFTRPRGMASFTDTTMT